MSVYMYVFVRLLYFHITFRIDSLQKIKKKTKRKHLCKNDKDSAELRDEFGGNVMKPSLAFLEQKVSFI